MTQPPAKPPPDLYGEIINHSFKLLSAMLVVTRVGILFWFSETVGNLVLGPTLVSLEEFSKTSQFFADLFYFVKISAAISQAAGFIIYLVSQLIRDIKGIPDDTK